MKTTFTQIIRMTQMEFMRNRRNSLKIFSAMLLGALLVGCATKVDLNQLMSAYHSEAIKAGVSRPAIDLNNPLLKARKIILACTINSLSSVEVIEQLLYLDSQSDEPINLYIDTSGGHLDQALAILDLIPTLRSPVNTWGIGKCNSGGAMLLMAGTGRRYVYPSTILMIHGPQVTSGDPPKEMTQFLLDRVNTVYRESAHLPDHWMPIGMNDLHFLTPTQAVEYGVADEVVGQAAEGRAAGAEAGRSRHSAKGEAGKAEVSQ